MTSQTEIKLDHSIAVVRGIGCHGTATRPRLSDVLGLSRATVGRVCEDLRRRGIADETGHEVYELGRPAAELALRSERGVVVGVELTASTVSVVTFDAALTPLTVTRKPIRSRERTPTPYRARVREAINEEIGRHRQPRFLGLGIAAPQTSKRALSGSSARAKPDPHSIVSDLGAWTDAPVVVSTPQDALAVSEVWTRLDRSSCDFIALVLGDEVGGALAQHGRIHLGNSSAAGQFGHVLLAAGGRPCQCGSSGCNAAYLSVSGVFETLRELNPSHPLVRRGARFSLDEVRAAADEGDTGAIEAIMTTGRYLGLALGSLLNGVNPATVVVDGDVVVKLGDLLVAATQPVVREQAMANCLVPFEVPQTHTDGGRVALGAAALALERNVRSALATPVRRRGPQKVDVIRTRQTPAMTPWRERPAIPSTWSPRRSRD